MINALSFEKQNREQKLAKWIRFDEGVTLKSNLFVKPVDKIKLSCIKTRLPLFEYECITNTTQTRRLYYISVNSCSCPLELVEEIRVESGVFRTSVSDGVTDKMLPRNLKTTARMLEIGTTKAYLA